MPLPSPSRRFLLSAAALTAAGALSAAGWQRRTHRRYPPQGRMLPLPSGPAHVVEGGRADGPALVLIHGSDGVAHDWPTSPLWPLLAPHYRLIAPDRLGHGYTPAGEEITVAAGARQLAELLDALGVERATLLGHSYGAPVALALAEQRPERVGGLVLVSPLAFPAPGLTRQLARLLAWPPAGWLVTRILLIPLGLAVVELEGGRAFAPAPMPHPWRRMMRAFSLRRSQLLALAEENRTIARELAALVPGYAALRMPIALLAGTQDALSPADDHAVPLAGQVPGAQLQLLDGGHQLHWTHPQEVAAAVRQVAWQGARKGAAL
ncbi:alpha/beta hydrolase fold protein [Deinococcus proteolyticus MRP]|uniref:Alpha/beta hydrolase fold protein n=1 Tax=Deinococcus proteolyticus (strain ATCC 35074 / DSM 20540 / JCM 6276 / NBRC 101906 / NCIMB 13154 / VKM Ac-1939 / CCM 2703 / MRP) TaxID=693977 RepID=F0RL38_DEIPM|nr:alpha/beta hydrolase [Deinococcus proteolyticus]ADY26830.1 alpha/beta hydrolase fold protein [Deinococcus proteolyticus MRP]